jgi:type I restriction enzyme M protein
LHRAKDRSERDQTWSEENPNGRWRVYSYEALMERGKANLDLFWIRHEALEDMDNLQDQT